MLMASSETEMPLIDVCNAQELSGQLSGQDQQHALTRSFIQAEPPTYSLMLLRPPSTQVGDVSRDWCASQAPRGRTTRLRGHCRRMAGRASSRPLGCPSQAMVMSNGGLLGIGCAIGRWTESHLGQLPPWGRRRRPGLSGCRVAGSALSRALYTTEAHVRRPKHAMASCQAL